MKDPLIKKFKPLMLILSLGFFALGGYVFFNVFQLGKNLPAKFIMGGGAALLIGALVCSRIRVYICPKCKKELVEGYWLFPPECLDDIVKAIESNLPDSLAQLVQTAPKPPEPKPGKLSYSSVDFEICPQCYGVGRFVSGKRTFGRADGTRVQVRRMGKYCLLAGPGVKEAMKKAEAMGRTGGLAVPSED